jgi:hypothetical protein
MSAEDQSPQRMSIVNLSTGFGITAQFNPEELKEKLAVAFNRLGILGMSHQPMQYQYTENLKVSFDLGFDVMSTRDIQAQGGANPADAVHGARRFLMSLCYPSKQAQDITGGGPPRALFIWPQLFSIECQITALSGSHKRFNLNGLSTLFSMSVEIEEVRVVRIFSEDVFNVGTIRSSNNPSN